MKTEMLPNGQMKVSDQVTLTDPKGNTFLQDIFSFWSWARNPKDKEARLYRGEDDGWVLESVELAE